MALLRQLQNSSWGSSKRIQFPTFVPRASMTFWERDKKAGYHDPDRPSVWDFTKLGAQQVIPELKKYVREWSDRFQFQNIEFVSHGSYRLLAQLNDQTALNDWVLTADSDHLQGKSRASFYLNERNYAVFEGYIDTTVPKDGVVKRAGYCAVRSPVATKSLKRASTYDYFADYTHLVVRYRGDGRPYLVNLKIQYDLDLGWQDVYSYPLFTRGGPYWQVAKIPFSKFFHGFKGRVQDKQWKVPLEKVEHYGITCSDQYSGPFHLELDYVGLLRDESHSENFAYEMYEVPVGVSNC